MITHKGIEANPDKCEAILAMANLSSIKVVQQLNGRLRALSRFIPRLAEKGKPFFKLLRTKKKFA